MAWQVCMTDEYNSTSIIENAPELNKAVKVIEAALANENVNNALTVDEKKRNWEFFFPEIFDEEGEHSVDEIYGGKNSKGEHCVISLDNPKELVPIENADVTFKFYLGNLDGDEWYAEDFRGNYILDFTHALLQGKSFYSLKKV